MEIIKGSLDDISRPASSDQTSSRASSVALPHGDRTGRVTPFSLVVLTKDDADIESRSEGTTTNSSARIQDPVEVTDDENEDSRLRRAMEEMRRLDIILSAKICTEKQVKSLRKELQAKLWQEFLQNKPEGHTECAQEAMNTRLFWALEAPTAIEDEDDFVPLFETQVPDSEHIRHGQHNKKHSEKKSDGWIGSSERSCEDAVEEGGLRGAPPKQKDFVKRNIELVIGEGDKVLLTRGEKEHLAELLEGVDEGEEDGARGARAGSQEDVWAVSVRTGQGYTPEPSDLQQLTDIDSKIRLLLPAEEPPSALGWCADLSVCQVQVYHCGGEKTSSRRVGTAASSPLLRRGDKAGGRRSTLTTPGRGSEAGWKPRWDLQPGEKVLQDIKERRGQERRLQEIQQQLEMLNQGQEMTDGSADLTEEQLLALLGECELTEGRTPDLETNDTTP